MRPPASLRPVSGPPHQIGALVRQWLDDETAAPLMVRTSGSSGEPKDVVLCASAVRASAAATLARLGGPGGWVLALPAHYVAGLQVIVRSLLAGLDSSRSPVLLDDHRSLSEATAALTADRRYLAIVPTQLSRWLAADPDIAALRQYDAVLLGGASTRPELLTAARERGIAVVTTYGMSETAGGCVYDGLALDGVAVALRTDGRVRLAGPVLFDGYDSRPDMTAEVLKDGWLLTPDLGRFDTDGRLVVLGRADDVAVSGGVNVPLPAVEARLAAMATIAHCAVVAVPDVDWGARVVAVVVATAGGRTPDLADVRDFVAAEHPRSWAPRELVSADELPLLESGKVDRRLLRHRLGRARV